MYFVRTEDLALVRSILIHPSVWPHVTDDFSGKPEEFCPNADLRIWYVLAVEQAEVAGLFTFLPRSTVLWEVHFALLPRRTRKARGTVIASRGLRWMLKHSTAERIVAEIPACNKLAVRLAAKVMNKFGVNFAAFRKHGELQDLICFGLSKPGDKTCPVS